MTDSPSSNQWVDKRPLTERLRSGFGGLVPPVCDEAANEIERLQRTEAAALRVASSRRDSVVTDKGALDRLDAALEGRVDVPLPDYRPAMKAAGCDEGVDCDTFIRVLQKKIADQQFALLRLQPALPPAAAPGLRSLSFQLRGTHVSLIVTFDTMENAQIARDNFTAWATTRPSGEPGEPPYRVRSFWSPCRKYLVTSYVSAGDIALMDDDSSIWEPTGQQQDVTHHEHCDVNDQVIRGKPCNCKIATGSRAAAETTPARWTRGGNLVGTSRQGTIDVPFSRVVEVFGEPDTDVDGYKVAFEWAITFPDGTIASIYDYSASSLYDDDLPSPEQMRKDDYSDWHIGGVRDGRAVELVRAALSENEHLQEKR